MPHLCHRVFSPLFWCPREVLPSLFARLGAFPAASSPPATMADSEDEGETPTQAVGKKLKADKPKAAKKGAKKSTVEGYDTDISTKQDYLEKSNVKIPIDKIEFDLDLSIGQSRQRDPLMVQRKLNSLKKNPPVGGLTGTLLYRDEGMYMFILYLILEINAPRRALWCLYAVCMQSFHLLFN